MTEESKPAEEVKPAGEGVKMDEAAKKEDAPTASAAQKEKLSRRLSARVGTLFHTKMPAAKPKKEGESKSAQCRMSSRLTDLESTSFYRLNHQREGRGSRPQGTRGGCTSHCDCLSASLSLF